MSDIKFKSLTKEQIIISLDRLTRFKHPETKYLRVYKDILVNNLLYPKYKKSELDAMDYAKLRDLAQEIINNSLDVFIKNNLEINKRILEYEEKVFKFDENALLLLDNNINYSACLNLLQEELPNNLRWLKELQNDCDMQKLRKEKGFHFPVEKVVIAEGATEEILLPEFAKFCGYDFDKNGVHLIAAGGKNQVVKCFYELSQCLKIPIFVLFDKDGAENSKEIQTKLRDCDKIHIIECGEFEDMLSLDLIKRTVNYELKNISIIEEQGLVEECSRVKFLEELFKTRGRHEFKKVEFAQMIKSNIISENDITQEIRVIIDEIKKL